jgi:hypothetical protein
MPCFIRCLSGETGVQFTPLSPIEKKIREFTKLQQLNQRKTSVHNKAKEIWNDQFNSNWAKLDRSGYAKLWRNQFNENPTDWELNEFYLYTLQQRVPWKHFELQKERENTVDKAIDLVFEHLNKAAQSATIDNPVDVSKNEFTNLLTKKLESLNSAPPNKAEVDNGWMQRARLNIVNWIGED